MKTLVYDIIATAGVIDAAGSRVLKPFGLTPMTFNILNVLEAGPLSQREIGDRVIVAASSITFQVRQLQKKGLIRRRRADARTWNVSLTPEGEKLRRGAEERMDALIARIGLPAPAVAGAKDALRLMRERIPTLFQEGAS